MEWVKPARNSWRPVINDARVGQQVGLAWKSVNRMPSWWMRSNVGCLDDRVAVAGEVAKSLVVGEDKTILGRPLAAAPASSGAPTAAFAKSRLVMESFQAFTPASHMVKATACFTYSQYSGQLPLGMEGRGDPYTCSPRNSSIFFTR